VLQTPLSRRESAQFRRKRLEILHVIQVNVYDRPSAYRIPFATLALECDAMSAPLSKLYSQKKTLYSAYNSKRPFLLDATHIPIP
jgi:hypothetical protein